jgi:hypothetical protein
MKEILATILSLTAIYGWFIYMAWPILIKICEVFGG